MEFNILKAKRANSSVFHILEQNQIYLKVNCQNETTYVKCYFDKCESKGKIKDNCFYPSSETNQEHKNHSHSVNSMLNYFLFFEELEKECCQSRENPKKVFQKIYLRLVYSFFK